MKRKSLRLPSPQICPAKPTEGGGAPQRGTVSAGCSRVRSKTRQVRWPGPARFPSAGSARGSGEAPREARERPAGLGHGGRRCRGTLHSPGRARRDDPLRCFLLFLLVFKTWRKEKDSAECEPRTPEVGTETRVAVTPTSGAPVSAQGAQRPGWGQTCCRISLHRVEPLKK